MTAETVEEAVAGRVLIADLMARYGRACDDRDLDAVGDCFTEDAQASYGGRVLGGGRAGIVAYIGGRLAALRASTHLMGNVVCHIDGDGGRAVTDGIAHLLLDTDGGTLLRVRGLRYTDTVRLCEDGCWRIRERVHEARWMFETPAADPATHRPG